VLYQGSLSPDRLPVSVLAALAMLPETVKLRVIGYEVIGSAGYIATLQKRACELGVLDRVDFPAGPMSRSELLEFGRKSDIGLSFMPMRTNDINMRAMTGASNKAFDYLACGLALLVSDLADWRSFFVAPGYGLACDPADSTSIANSLSTFLGNLKETRAMGEKGRRRVAAEWNYETQFEPVLAAIQSAPPR
jgi:glycosyltransferase involved in cell wall biosynthesis